MGFSNRLDFLMKLTHTTNKELGNLLSIHQSQISRMRSGSRGIPGNSEYVRLMGEHFASMCIHNYQRSALAEALGRPPLRLPMEKGVLSVILTEWLMGSAGDGREKAEQFLNNYSAFAIGPESSSGGAPASADLFQSGGDMIAYYGDDGKRAAVSAFLNYLLELGEPLQIDLSGDESIGWLINDQSFSEKLNDYMTMLADIGCTARRIVRPMGNLEGSYLSFVQRWLPLYISGHVTSFYYPRLRDGVYHRTLFVAPGRAAVFSSSFGRQAQSKVTFFVKDGKVANALDREFEDYLNICHPHMITCDAKKMTRRFIEQLIECDNLEYPCIQRSSALSSITLPASVASTLRVKSQDEQRLFTDLFFSRTDAFRAFLRDYPFTDMMYVADVKDIIANKVSIPAALTLDCTPRRYTLDTYLLHLQNILWYLENYPNYHIVLTEKMQDGIGFVCVKENHRALLMRDNDPYSVFEITERNLVAVFSEMLHRAIVNDKPDQAMRRKSIARLRELASQLEEIRKKRES